MNGWSRAVPNGTYQVTLKLRESWFDGPGQRIFSVAAEGTPVITDLDVFAVAGKDTAYDRSFPVTVRDGRLDLSFSARVDDPMAVPYTHLDVYKRQVIGGGIVGLATAMTLLKGRPGSDVVVLEKENDVARHQTGHNSGVIHAGIYYKPGSLKAKLCKAGAQWTRDFCDEHGIPYRNTGKLIVATNPAELERMHALYERALLNELDVELVDEAELRRREPNITGIGAIFLKSTGIVDYTAVCRTMAEVIEAQGGKLRLSTRVTAIHESLSEVSIDVATGDVEPERIYAKQLVVCGGIQADRLALSLIHI